METIGAKILEIRKRKGLTQEKLSELNMEDILDYGKNDNLKFLKYFHLSVMICVFFPLGNVILPLVL